MKKIKLVWLVILFSLIFSVSSAYGTVLLHQVKLKAVGDIMVHDVQYNSMYDWKTDTYDFMPMFEPVQEFLKADILVGNLETTLSGPELGYSSYPRFNSPDNIAQTLGKLGFNFLFTANNHCLDQGEYGLKRTLRILDKYTIAHTGTFASREDRLNPRILKTNGITFGFLNYTYSTNGLEVPEGKDYLVNYLELEKIKKDIEFLRPQVEMLVVGLHFGNEYWRKPSAEQKRIANKVAEYGADIILGGHSHVLQPYEFIKVKDRQCFVVYSLGNFVSGQKKRYRNSGAILELTIEKNLFDESPKIVEVKFTPIWVRRYYHAGRLKMEVVPFSEKAALKPPLSQLEEKIFTQVNEDVNQIWEPIVKPDNINEVFSLWTNKILPPITPHWLLPFFLILE